MASVRLLAILILSLCSDFTLHTLNAVAGERILMFPEESVGIVTVSNAPVSDGPDIVFDQHPKNIYQATGKVAVDSDQFTGLEISATGAKDLSFLRQLPASSISEIKITNAALDQSQMWHIVQLTSLVKLDLIGCNFSTNAFDNLPALPELKYLRISHSDSRLEQGKAVSDWISKQLNLQTLYCTPGLSPQDLDEIGSHPNLQSTTIDLDSDAKATLSMLKKIPQLRSLSIMVKEDIDKDALKDIGNLSQLERLRWFYGRVEGDVLRQIASHGRLEQLMFFQIEPGQDFSESLESFKGLTHLEITLPDETVLDDLPDHLLRMKSLRNWPALKEVNAETLAQIADCNHIESLTLNEISPEVSPDLLARLANLKQLRRLDLQHIPVRDEWLNSLADMKHLEYLHLWNTDITGSGFTALKDLTELREIHLWYDGSNNEGWIQRELQSLSHLPALEVLHIGGHFRPDDLDSLRECRRLSQIRLWGGGFSNDITAVQLAELPELIELIMSENAIISDVGAKALSQHSRLQRLFVGGPVTITGASKLAKIPTLRQLGVASSLIEPNEVEALKKSSSGLPSLSVRPFSGSIFVGKDGLLRIRSSDRRNSVRSEDGPWPQGTSLLTMQEQMDALEGLPAPPLNLESSPNGTGDTWESLRGKVVLIQFWGTWCGPCKRQLPELKELQAKYQHQGFQVIGIHSGHGAEDLDEYLTKKPLPWTNIVDSDNSLAAAYHVEGYPKLFLVDRQGVLRVASPHDLDLEHAVNVILSQPTLKN